MLGIYLLSLIMFLEWVVLRFAHTSCYADLFIAIRPIEGLGGVSSIGMLMLPNILLRAIVITMRLLYHLSHYCWYAVGLQIVSRQPDPCLLILIVVAVSFNFGTYSIYKEQGVSTCLDADSTGKPWTPGYRHSLWKPHTFIASVICTSNVHSLMRILIVRVQA